MDKVLQLREQRRTFLLEGKKLLEDGGSVNQELAQTKLLLARDLETQIRALEAVERTISDMNQPQARQIRQAPGPVDGSGNMNMHSNEEWRDLASGQLVRVLRNEQRASDVPELKEKGAGTLSVGRAIRAMITGRAEHRVNAEQELRALSTTSNPNGGVLVGGELSSQILDLARNRAVLALAGCGFVPMSTSTLTMAKIATDPAFVVKGENSAFSESNPTFLPVTFHAFTIGTMCSMSRELVEDGVGVEALIETQLANSFAIELDRLGLGGSGSAEPLGVSLTVGVQEITTVGAITYDHILDALEDCEEENFTARTLISAPNVKHDLAITKMTVETASYVAAPPEYLALQRLVTNGVVSGESYVGDFTPVLYAIRQDPLIEFSTTAETAFSKHQVLVKLTWRGDVVLTQPKAVVCLRGIS